jgi:hypothetical protein
VKGKRLFEAALHNHSFSVSQPAVAGGAENIKTLVAAFQHFFGYGKGKGFNRCAVNLSGVEKFIGAQVVASHCVVNQLPGRAIVREEGAAFKRFIARLVAHVHCATGHDKEQTN